MHGNKLALGQDTIIPFQNYKTKNLTNPENVLDITAKKYNAN